MRNFTPFSKRCTYSDCYNYNRNVRYSDCVRGPGAAFDLRLFAIVVAVVNCCSTLFVHKLCPDQIPNGAHEYPEWNSRDCAVKEGVFFATERRV